jgi:hypothetical protein
MLPWRRSDGTERLIDVEASIGGTIYTFRKSVNYEYDLTYMTVIKLNMVTCGRIMHREAAVIYNMKTISNSSSKYIKSSI